MIYVDGQVTYCQPSPNHHGHPMLDKSKRDTFVSSYLLYLLAASSEAVSSQFHEVVRSKGVRVPEWRVMACLYDQDGLIVTHLAEYALLEQSRLTRVIDQMDNKGLVSRNAGIDDRRKVTVHLTANGKALAKELVALAKEHEKAILRLVDDTDAANLKPILQTLLSKLDASDLNN